VYGLCQLKIEFGKNNALTTDRPYRQGFSKKDAFEIMQKEKSKYDPELLKVFVKTME